MKFTIVEFKAESEILVVKDKMELIKWQPSMRGSCTESVFIFQFLNEKKHNYVKQNLTVHFIIRKV